jgi:preprotein translocase subunit SecF
MFNIVGKRYWYFALSLAVIIPGLIFMGLNLARTGEILPLAIDFKGGSLLEVEFTQPLPEVQPAEIKDFLVNQVGLAGDTQVQRSGDRGLIIRTEAIDEAKKNAVQSKLAERFQVPLDLSKQRFESVGPAVGNEVTRAAVLAVVAASVGILLYIAFAFRQMPKPLRYGTCAIIAMLHDVLVVTGAAAIFGYFLGWQVDALFLTALLTVIGFSVHDTIVVFDRIRENLLKFRGEPFEAIVNHSIVQTLDRSINTQLVVMFTLTSLVLFGGSTIRHFVVTMMVGILSGTYSSIFNAAPLLVVWENGEIGQFLRRLLGRGAPATPKLSA